MKADIDELICLACYRNRLASVCENADGYKLFEIRDDKFYPAGRLSLPSKDPMDRTSAILTCGVTFFLCGAICDQMRIRLQSHGVVVIPWLTGAIDDVLHGFRHNSYDSLLMPGCVKQQFGQPSDAVSCLWGKSSV